MVGFEIKYNGNVIYVAVENGLLTVSVQDVDGKGYVYVGTAEYGQQKQNTWMDFVPLCPGDRIEVKMVEMKQISPPETSKSVRVERVQSLREILEMREIYLKEQGLL